MRAGRFLMLVLALQASAPAWGQAPESSPRPRPRVASSAPEMPMSPVPAGGVEAAIAAAMAAPPPRPAGAMTIAEAARAQAEQSAAEAAAAAAPSAPPVVAIAEALPDGSVSPLAVPRSAFPQRRQAAVVQRYAELQRARAQGRTEVPQQAQPQQAAAAPRRAGGSSGSGLCGAPGLAGRQIARITSSTRGCGVEEPVSVTSVQGIPLSMAATIDCPTAVALDRWVRQEALPAIGNTGGGVVQIRVAAHYSCRPRNNQSGARISEHGRGRAIDIGGFRLANGQTVTVLEHYRRGPFSRAMQAMYRGACGIFGTTLGPTADRFHQDHFHFDTARYRNGSYCR